MTKTLIMGIINTTPDSYYETSRALTTEKAIETALRMESEGASIIDIGGESTRPYAKAVSEQEELDRVIPVIKTLQGQLTIPISIDTIKPTVARAAIKAGASLLNDVSGFRTPDMVEVAKEFDGDICVMHMQGEPQTMQDSPYYEEGIVTHLMNWFEKKANFLVKEGIHPSRIILDPGIGFGKTVADNLKILHNLPKFRRLGFRLLLGISRKSFMKKILNKPFEELLPSTLAINGLAIMAGVDILRVHDVKEHVDVVKVLEAYKAEE